MRGATRVGWDYLLLGIPIFAFVILIYGWPFDGDFDVYGHLARGRLMAESGSVVALDPFSFTTSGQADELHSWLAQWIFWVVFSAFGSAGLKAVAGLCILGGGFLAYRFVLKHSSDRAAALIAVTLYLLIEREKFSLRPFLFGELIAAVLLLYWLDYSRRPTWGQVFWVVTIVIAWANLHGSALMALPLVGSYVLAYWLFPSPRQPVPRQRLAAMFAMVGIGTLLTPNGFALISQTLSLGTLGKACQIGEWMPRSPLTLLGDGASGYRLRVGIDTASLVHLLGVGFVLWRLYRSRSEQPQRFVQWGLLTILFGSLPLVAQRHRSYLAFVAALALILAVERLRELKWQNRFSTVVPAAVLCAGLFVAVGFHRYPLVADGLAPTQRFIAATRLEGNVFNFSSWGSYLSYHFYPWIRTAIDGRLWVHRKMFGEKAKQIREYGIEASHLLLRHVPDADIVVEHSFPLWEDRFDPQEWIAVFENNQTVILLRRGESNEENLARVVEYYRREQVPFDRSTGFDAKAAYAKNPGWLLRVQAVPSWGRWPDPNLRHKMLSRFENYFRERGLSNVGGLQS